MVAQPLGLLPSRASLAFAKATDKQLLAQLHCYWAVAYRALLAFGKKVKGLHPWAKLASQASFMALHNGYKKSGFPSVIHNIFWLSWAS